VDGATCDAPYRKETQRLLPTIQLMSLPTAATSRMALVSVSDKALKEYKQRARTMVCEVPFSKAKCGPIRNVGRMPSDFIFRYADGFLGRT
jgi:hypothetical protein